MNSSFKIVGVALALLTVGLLGLSPASAGDLLVLGESKSEVLRYNGDTGAFESVLVSAGSGGLATPHFMVIGPDASLYVSSSASNQILRYNRLSGAFIDAFVPAGSGGLSSPQGLAFGPDGNLYVANLGTNQVLRYDGISGAFIDGFVSSGSGGLALPLGLTFGSDLNLYVASLGTDRVLRYDGTTGAFIDAFVAAGSGGLDQPIDLTFGPDGRLYVTSELTNQVLRYDGTTGAFVNAFVTAGSGGLSLPGGLAFGPDGNLYVADQNNDGVRRYDGTTGAFIDTFVTTGSGGLAVPIGLLFVPVVDFVDVPAGSPFRPSIEAVVGGGFLGGCSTSPSRFCPTAGVTRAQMAQLLLRGIHGAEYAPPAATGTIFTDVPITHPLAAWIEELAIEGITTGCSLPPRRYCPDGGVTRAEIAVFLLRARHGAGYDPPAPTPLFDDVPLTHPFAKWIDQVAREGITAGCRAIQPRYCPDVAVTREQMSAFLLRTFAVP